MGELQERITTTSRGSVTSIQAVYVPADDFTDPAAVHTFSHLSASIVLSRKRASQGLYPAIDPLISWSKYVEQMKETLDKIDPTDLSQNVAAYAAFLYLAAEIPGHFRED